MTNPPTEKPVIKWVIIIIAILELLALPPWLLLANLSLMQFMDFPGLMAFMFTLPIWLYPLLIGLFTSMAFRSCKKRKSSHTVFLSLLPVIISFGWYVLVLMVAIILDL